MKRLHEQVVGSEKYARFTAVCEKMVATDVRALIDEVERIQEERSSRPLILKPSTKRIVAMNMQEQAMRSRVIYIALSARKSYDLLNFSCDTIHEWIISQFRSQLTGNQSEKFYTASRFTVKYRQHLTLLATLLEVCDMVVKDIDSSSWRLKSVVSTLELESRPEVRV
jgi:hypothetical protein